MQYTAPIVNIRFEIRQRLRCDYYAVYTSSLDIHYKIGDELYKIVEDIIVGKFIGFFKNHL